MSTKGNVILGAAIAGVCLAGYAGYKYLLAKARREREAGFSDEERVLYQQLSRVSSFCRQSSNPTKPGAESLTDMRFSEIDKDRNGYITRDEFEDHIRGFVEMFKQANPNIEIQLVDEEGNPDYKRAVEEAFEQVDINRDGVIDRTEFNAMTEQFLSTLLFGDKAIPL